MPKIHDKDFNLYISAEQIDQRISEMALAIESDFPNSVPLIISILNGAFIFSADLARKIKSDIEFSFIRVKSYEGTSSSGSVKSILGLEEDIKGRDVILLDDIIDTGFTFKHLIAELEKLNPKSIKTCCLLFKKEAFNENFKIDYKGFEIENKFVVGYGLDYNERGRNLEGIYILQK